MSATDKIKNAAQDAKGKVKETVGRATSHDRMATDGKKDQAAAHVKNAAEKAKDTAKHGMEAAKGKVKEGMGKASGDDRMAAEGQTDQSVASLKEDLNK